MSRKKSKANVRQKIIETGIDLFHKQGITATSVDEILEASGAGKGQFYHYFKSKDGLVHQVLVALYNGLKAEQTPSAMRIETWDELENWFRTLINFQRSIHYERGCPVGTMGSDLSNSQELLRQDVKLIFLFMRDILARFFAAAKAKGELSSSADPDSLANLCLTIQQGGMLVSKIEKDDQTFQKSVSQLFDYLRLLRTSPQSPLSSQEKPLT
jgi:TetR/AcrR family transcriptional repressor of nem operon